MSLYLRPKTANIMTEEGQQLLQTFVAHRDFYVAHRKAFRTYARRHSEEYAREELKRRVGYGTFWLSIPVFWLNGPGLVKWLSIFGIILGLIMGIASKVSQLELWRLVGDYLQLCAMPPDEKELAYRVFSGEKIFSDLPQFKLWIRQGLIDPADLYDAGYRIDLEEV